MSMVPGTPFNVIHTHTHTHGAKLLSAATITQGKDYQIIF